MNEIARPSDPPRVARDGGDPAVERLGEMAQSKGPLKAPGVEGEKAEGKVELEEGKKLLGKPLGRAERCFDQALYLDRRVRDFGEARRETDSVVERDGDQIRMRCGGEGRIDAHGRLSADTKQAVSRKTPKSLDPPGKEEQGLPAAS
jgi:hypothetical protein